MVESRIAPRFRTAKPARIEFGGHKIPCVVRDLSLTGAAIELSDKNVVVPPNKFTLFVIMDKLKLPARLVWRRDCRAGIAFD